MIVIHSRQIDLYFFDSIDKVNYENILITGGSRGIGREIVKTCLNEGYYVHFTYANDLSSAEQMHKEMNSKKLSF